MQASRYTPSGHRTAFATTAFIVSVLSALCGCVANKYRLAKKDLPPVQLLNIAFTPAPPVQLTLVGLVSYGGPGSWKREALWDEYVVTIENHSERQVTIEPATLADSAGTPFPAATDPWALEKQSKELEKQYARRGEAFLRAAGPGALITGVGAVAAAATAGAGWAVVSPAAAGAVAATVLVLPVYYISVLGINHHNKKAVLTEFKRRRLALPLTLAPGEIRTGSLFFPMIRSPRSLTLEGANESGTLNAALPLDFLKTLHVPGGPGVSVAH
jgi:hypothetical protein